MAERMVPKPDLIGEEAAISGLNLSVLQRLDPLIEEILAVATHAFVYEIDAVTDSWVCSLNFLLIKSFSFSFISSLFV